MSKEIMTYYNRYGEYDPGREDNPQYWKGKCDTCGEWISSDEPVKILSVYRVAHRHCPNPTNRTQSDNLTPKQKKVLDFINAYIAHHGFSPTLREIAQATGIAGERSAWNMVKILEKRRLLNKNRPKRTAPKSLEIDTSSTHIKEFYPDAYYETP